MLLLSAISGIYYTGCPTVNIYHLYYTKMCVYYYYDYYYHYHNHY